MSSQRVSEEAFGFTTIAYTTVKCCWCAQLRVRRGGGVCLLSKAA